VSTPDSKPVADEVAPVRTTDPPTSTSMPAWLRPPSASPSGTCWGPSRCSGSSARYATCSAWCSWPRSSARARTGGEWVAPTRLVPRSGNRHVVARRHGVLLDPGTERDPDHVRNIDQIADDVPGWIDDVNEFTQREFDVQLIPDTAIDPSESGVGVAKNFVADYGGAGRRRGGASRARSSPSSRSPCSPST
jgi:hypothetical protein